MSDFGLQPSGQREPRVASKGAAAVSLHLALRGFAFQWMAVVAVLLGLVTSSLLHAEKIPPKPAHYFNDYARVVPLGTANALDGELEQFERDTSNQLVVAVYQKMESESSVEDYTVRVAQSWGVGQKEKKNGAVLFVFVDNHQVYISVGYGLEPVLTDALCRQIIENEITPRFRSGDFAAGVAAGVHAMMSASRGEYRGTGRTNSASLRHGSGMSPVFFFVIFMIVVGWISKAFRRNRPSYGQRGWRSDDDRFGPGGGFGGFGGFGGGGGGGGSSGGGGGFSGGGGSFGGGGAGGRW